MTYMRLSEGGFQVATLLGCGPGYQDLVQGPGKI